MGDLMTDLHAVKKKSLVEFEASDCLSSPENEYSSAWFRRLPSS